MKGEIYTAALPPRRSVRPAAPACALPHSGLGGSPCAPRSGSECAPAARRFCALRAPVLGSMSPNCAPFGRAICPPSAGEGKKKAHRLRRALFLRVCKSTRQSQRISQSPSKLPLATLLKSVLRSLILCRNSLNIPTGLLSYLHHALPL